MRRFAAVVVLAAATLARAEAPPRSWRDGPVRYLLTPDEYHRYARLRTPEARMLVEDVQNDKELPVRHAATSLLREWPA